MDLRQRLEAAVAYVRRKTKLRPQLALILGSGLGALAAEVKADAIVPYADIPHFPQSTVEGHAGRLVVGQLEGKPVVAMQGRVHYYEGYPVADVVFPLRVMRMLGAQTLIVSNAAGGVNRQWQAGDLMLIADHINLTGANPLIGANDPELGPRFPDMLQAYDPELIALAERVALGEGVAIRKGVYLGLAGPNYETAAEYRMIALLGADAVGMSTVPEVIAARHMGMRVLGISAITDLHTGESAEPTSHEVVIAVAKQIEPKFVRLVKRIVREMTL